MVNVVYTPPPRATAHYKHRLTLEVFSAIRAARQIAERDERAQVSTVVLQSALRGYLVRCKLHFAQAQREQAVRASLEERHVHRGGVLGRAGPMIPEVIQRLILNWVPVEPEIAFGNTSVGRGLQFNPCHLF